MSMEQFGAPAEQPEDELAKTTRILRSVESGENDIMRGMRMAVASNLESLRDEPQKISELEARLSREGLGLDSVLNVAEDLRSLALSLAALKSAPLASDKFKKVLDGIVATIEKASAVGA